MNKKVYKVLTLIVFISISFSHTTAAINAPAEKEKVIYLTFDDGPSKLTPTVLDILKEYDVKATFFLIGNQIKGLEPIVSRIYNEGHSIGLHSYTHNISRIYSSSEVFINEMSKTQEEIFKVTGTRPNILRFPCGSIRRLNISFLNEIHKHNFKIYDWNAYMSDGENAKASPEKFYREATETTVKFHPIILLMHCDYGHKNTIVALPRVIKYYKDKGYDFKTITEDTPEYYFPIKRK